MIVVMDPPRCSTVAMVKGGLVLAACLAGPVACSPTARPPAAARPITAQAPVATAPPRQAASRDAPGTPACDYKPPALVPLGETVTFGDFVAALARQIAGTDPSAIRPEFLEMAARRAWDPDKAGLFEDYVRVRTLFEAARDGGYWRLRWAITDREPSSAEIWRAWQKEPVVEAFGSPSATAECDELSALYSLLARRLGVKSVGLFYPTWNHTIAAWAPHQLSRGKSRVVLIPTTQIFLGCSEGLDTTSFRTSLTSIGEYPRWDVRDSTVIPRDRARFLLDQVRVYGPTSPDLQALLRATRARAFGSSGARCPDYRTELANRLRSRLTCADRFALAYFAERELGRHAVDAGKLVDALAAP
jgi:hypothetical protein